MILKGTAFAIPGCMVGFAAESADVGSTTLITGVGQAVPLVADWFVSGGNPLALLVLDQKGFVVVATSGAVGTESTEKAKDSSGIGRDFVIKAGSFGRGGMVTVPSSE